ncbi:MAG: hypothetical protein ACFFDN_21280 [Candidatus Hodarchaeota archaeon]
MKRIEEEAVKSKSGDLANIGKFIVFITISIIAIIIAIALANFLNFYSSGLASLNQVLDILIKLRYYDMFF